MSTGSIYDRLDSDEQWELHTNGAIVFSLQWCLVEGTAVHLQNPSLMKEASPASASIKNGRSEPLGLNAETGENSQIIKMIIE